jgi:hypothetical protein
MPPFNGAVPDPEAPEALVLATPVELFGFCGVDEPELFAC